MRLKMMIVDDSNIIRNKIARSLARHQIDIVAKSSNGEEAVRHFRENEPDIVTMDLTMPRMDGLECIRQLKKHKPSIRILVVSALADKATAIQALKEGAMGFLCKPFSEDELCDAIDELLRGDE